MRYSRTREDILELLFDNPSKIYHLREISRELEISVSAVSKALRELEKEKLIRLEKKVILEIIADTNEKFRRLKRVNNIKKIYENGLFDFLNERYPFSLVILFGSYSLGEDIEKSDIDIYVDSKKEVDLSKFEKVYNRKINLEAKLYKEISRDMKKTLINGIILNGSIP